MRPVPRALGVLLTAALATAQAGVNGGANPRVTVESCVSLTCGVAGSSICGSDGRPGPPRGVGIAPQAVNSSLGSLSLTLIDGMQENGFTGIGSDAYEHSSLELFVGAGASERFPSGCALMMQYQGQTFPREALASPGRPERDEDTTSCTGVFDVFCRAAIVDMVLSFAPSSIGNGTRCGRLTEHVNAELQKIQTTCGSEGTWIANFMNVTGGALPMANSTRAESPELGSHVCQPVLPQSYNMYSVASMRQLTFADPPKSASEFLGNLYGGRAGFTPVAAVIYGDGDDDESPDVHFACMKTFKRDGSPRDEPFESGAAALVGLVRGLPAALLVAAVAFL